MSSVPHTITVLDKLRSNSHLNKHSHFEEAKTGRGRHIVVGIPIVVINVFLGSILFALIKTTIPEEMKWLGAILALVAAVLGAVQTFFNFKANYEGHQSVATQYLSIARECERVIAAYLDGLVKLSEVAKSVETLNGRYEKVSVEAAKFGVAPRQFKKAKAVEDQKKAGQLSVLQEAQLRLEATRPEDPKPTVPNGVTSARPTS